MSLSFDVQTLKKKTDGDFHPSGDSVGIRTQDPQLRRLLLYPAELRNQRTISEMRVQRYKNIFKSQRNIGNYLQKYH